MFMSVIVDGANHYYDQTRKGDFKFSFTLIEYRCDDITKNNFFFLHFSVLDTMYRWRMMENIHSPNLVGNGSWGPEIWPHEYLISPTEISVNWPGSKQL